MQVPVQPREKSPIAALDPAVKNVAAQVENHHGGGGKAKDYKCEALPESKEPGEYDRLS